MGSTMRTTIALVWDKLRAMVGSFRRPRYVTVTVFDITACRDYWVKSRIHADGTSEIIDRGVNEHRPANAGGEFRRGSDVNSTVLLGVPKIGNKL